MALLNAIITCKENTLVTEFPRDYLKIYEELNSIGSRKAPERIPLTDNEGDDIRVKLYADSDIGNHLLLLLGESSTLADANTSAARRSRRMAPSGPRISGPNCTAICS